MTVVPNDTTETEGKHVKTIYFHSNENDRFYSLDELRTDYERFRSEGECEDETFEDYLRNCMYWNNGDLTPALEYCDRLRKELAKVEGFALADGKHGPLGLVTVEPSHEYDDWINDLKAQISEAYQYI